MKFPRVGSSLKPTYRIEFEYIYMYSRVVLDDGKSNMKAHSEEGCGVIINTFKQFVKVTRDMSYFEITHPNENNSYGCGI
ncbi:hypothetical protein V1478_007327 [Vespula squamosa]|uniref:Uncharacterized protein n=1 Tax=Vespula squamosa TaxID=30214 RepID=A0ABD2B2T5_VESSQ